MFTLPKIFQSSMRCGRASALSRRRRGACYSCSCGGDNKSSKGGKGPCDPCDPCDPCEPCPVCRCPSDLNPSTPTMYDIRKYGHSLPCSNVMPCFEPLPNIPTGIFRCTAGEVLGRGAAKCSYYQNPEYFSFQHMTFFDMHLILRYFRIPCPKTGRKPFII